MSDIANRHRIIAQNVRLELETGPGHYPLAVVTATAIVASMSLDIDAVELSKFKAEVCRFIEERLPSYIKVVDGRTAK